MAQGAVEPDTGILTEGGSWSSMVPKEEKIGIRTAGPQGGVGWGLNTLIPEMDGVVSWIYPGNRPDTWALE